MYDSEDDGEDGPGESTWSGVTLGGNVFNPNVGEADTMGTARLFDIIRLDIDDRYGWPGVWLGVASPYWLPWVVKLVTCSYWCRATEYDCSVNTYL